MDKIQIEGGVPLKGTVKTSGAKNAALPLLASALLADGECRFDNVPALRDIDNILKLLKHLGADFAWTGPNSVAIDASNISGFDAPYELVRRMRASILVLGPLVARMKKARVSLPGGCAIGARPINLHLKALEQMGAKIVLKHGYVEADCGGLSGDDIYFDTPTVTGTENIMMAAALAKGETILRNCAKEPEIVALAAALNSMGAKIEGAGESKICIQGVSSLKPARVRVIPDRIEAGTFMVAAALTRGEIEVRDCEPAHMGAVIHKLKQSGAVVDVDEKAQTIMVAGGEKISSLDIKTLPFPGFPTDMQAQFTVLMSVASGLSTITETVFENRFIHVSELRRLGADIKVEGNTAFVRGAPSLSGAPVMATDLRASASLVLAGLAAGGITEVSRIYHLDRGYERLEEKFRGLGAAIRRVKG